MVRKTPQEKFNRMKAAAGRAARQDKKDKQALTARMEGKSPGKLSKKELQLAKRMSEGEGHKKKK